MSKESDSDLGCAWVIVALIVCFTIVMIQGMNHDQELRLLKIKSGTLKEKGGDE